MDYTIIDILFFLMVLLVLEQLINDYWYLTLNITYNTHHKVYGGLRWVIIPILKYSLYI